MFEKGFAILTLCALLNVSTVGQKIDRKQLVERHHIKVTSYDSLSSLSIGNGRFAFTADITGLQSFPAPYAGGVPLGTQSEWGWHTFVNKEQYRFDETLKDYFLNGRNVSYSVQLKEPARSVQAVNWFRQNPHRLQLGNIGLELIKKDGQQATIADIKNIDQSLDLYSGKLYSRFEIDDAPVEVISYCHQSEDVISVQIKSELLQQRRLKIVIRFPYPTGEWKDVGINYRNDQAHQSVIIDRGSDGCLIKRTLDSTIYFVGIRSDNIQSIEQSDAHKITVIPVEKKQCQVSFRFCDTKQRGAIPTFTQTKLSNENSWTKFWQKGAAVDFEGSTDPRAHELERRIILSQYLTKIQCAGNFPPQETGLTYNSWFGKPHMEMHWWHAIHFALWNRHGILEKQLSWYRVALNNAYAIARRQGYLGARWQKMTDHAGGESPSSVGAFLIWQQPHLISFAEILYRNKNDVNVLQKYRDLVFATADFMASYPHYDSVFKKYNLGKGVIAAQERFKAEETFNPAYEIVYWYWGLQTAQQWRKRLGLKPNEKWQTVIDRLSPLVIRDNKYLFAESAIDSYANPEYRTDHPSVLGALGMLPHSNLVDTSVMKNTFDWIWNNWNWTDTWGWDFPLTAMTATRLNMPARAIDALLMPIRTNTYLVNGHNYQDGRLTIYLPGNGGLLTAVALMCAGWEGSRFENPGFPKNNEWKVKWEGFRKMF